MVEVRDGLFYAEGTVDGIIRLGGDSPLTGTVMFSHDGLVVMDYRTSGLRLVFEMKNACVSWGFLVQSTVFSLSRLLRFCPFLKFLRHSH